MSGYQYLVCIGNDGYEAMLDMTGIQEEEVIAALKGKDTKRLAEFHHFITTMPLRIRFNSHRDIKVYVIESELEYEVFMSMLCESKELCRTIQEKHESLKGF